VLPRLMGPALATSLVVSNVIGVGIFTTSGLLAKDLADPRILLASGSWAACWRLRAPSATRNWERSSREPAASTHSSGRPMARCRVPRGWGSLFAGFSAPIAAAAVGFTEYSAPISRAGHSHGGSAAQWALRPGHAVAAAVIILLSALHYRKVQLGGPVHIGLTAFKVGVIVIFILAGFLWGRGDPGRFHAALAFSEWPALAPAVGAGLIFVMFSYSGWNAASIHRGGDPEPAAQPPTLPGRGTLVVIALYVAINALYIYAIPIKEMANVIRIAELASLNLFGLNVAPFLNLIFMGTILGSISAMVIAGPRVYYAIAQDGLFPKAIARVHPRFGTPANAIVLQAAWSIVLLFSGRFEQLLTFSGS